MVHSVSPGPDSLSEADSKMSSSISRMMAQYRCDPQSPCQSHSEIFRQVEQAEHVSSTHDKPDRKYPLWSQSGQRRKEDNEEEDLLKEWST